MIFSLSCLSPEKKRGKDSGGVRTGLLFLPQRPPPRQRTRSEAGFLGWGLFLPGMETYICFCILSCPLHLPASLRRERGRKERRSDSAVATTPNPLASGKYP